jgi:hypothetical protein
MSKRNILLIENQQTQYVKIHNMFRDNCEHLYEIVPDRNTFIPFITWVRIYVNTENSSDRRSTALNKIIDKIINSKIELILMDYKLGAPFMSWTGVELGKQINLELKQKGTKPLPMVFMSKDLVENNKKYCDELNDYESNGFHAYETIHKGYFGKQILETDYFKDKIIPAINFYLQDSEH